MSDIATIIQDGTGQDRRMPDALRPDYFRPDEMDLPELLFLGSRFASQLTFFGADNQAGGDWHPLFANDISALLGEILAETQLTEPWQRIFKGSLVQMQAFLMNLSGCPQPEAVPAYRLDKLIRRWAADCRHNPEPAAQRLSETLDGLIITYLDPTLGALVAYLAGHDERHKTILPQGVSTETAADAAIQPPPHDSGFGVVSQFFTDTFSTYINALAVIRKVAEAQFPLSLDTGRHDPAAGLYLTFARLYLKAKDSINDFSQRQMRFYYERILRFRRHAIQPDSAYLVLSADGTLPEAPVSPGTQFIGGEDARGNEVTFTNEEEILVNDAHVVDLKTLYFDRDPLHSPEKDLAYATSARFTSIPAIPDSRYYPLFGAARKKENVVNADARLGFAIASPVLKMYEGAREVVIDLHFEPGPENLDWLIGRLREIIGDASTEGAFFKAYANAFAIHLTTAEGWRKVPAYIRGCHLVDTDVRKDCLRIELSLPEEFPPIVEHDPNLHTGAFDHNNPVISIQIEPDAYLYPYDFLSRQSLRYVDIKVAVRGHRDLTLYNNNGELSAASPFNPFGPLPRVGSHLIVGSHEAFSKQLTALELNVDWDGLPASGLENHYRAYHGNMCADSFRMALSALNDRTWRPEKKAERIVLPLFKSEEDGRTHYDCSRLLPYMGQGDPTNRGYGQHSRGGFIRMSLTNPPQAFGHADYPQLLASALTRNSRLDALGPIRRILGRKGTLPIPEAPYTPQISAISINYAAQARISPQLASAGATRERFYHLHPFGIETISLNTHGKTPLIPCTPHRANLYIGIEASELGGPLTLYFHLRNDSELDTWLTSPVFTWSCLNGNHWQPLEDFRILSDTTRGFLISGIVRLDIPNDMVRGDPQMPDSPYWLRVSTDGDASALCSVYGVYAHGVRVSRLIDEKSPEPERLPAGSIQSAKTSLPGIARIQQPADSFGGRQKESEEAMTKRANERLRHRQRAVSPWDYERLVLQRFPQLQKVKCFPNTVFTPDANKRHQPGNVLIVVVPQLGHTGDTGEVHKENILLLRDIKNYLNDLASPFVNIDVRNPVYERIQVRCAVKFQGAGNDGLLLKQLNRDIRNFISPWSDLGNNSNFGWSLRAQEIQGYLHGLPYVQSAWGLSLLRVVENREEHYVLTDTTTAEQTGLAELSPLYPWSLAVPFRHHLIETDADRLPDPHGPWHTGISRLQVGTTFIVSGN